VLSAVHIDYLRSAGVGDDLIATARIAEVLPRVDLSEVRVIRAGQEAVARQRMRHPLAAGLSSRGGVRD